MDRRTRKQYRTAVEEFFYDPTGQLLSERSFADEYIWLGDMPVAMVRTLFTGAMVRTADWNGVPSNGSTVCPRRNEDARCATFFYVSDMQGRPTASIDKDAYLTGVGEYDAFGAINRVVQRAETTHPYSGSQNYNLVTQTGRDRFAYTLPMRARFSFVDTNAYYTCGSLSCVDSDRAEVRDVGVKLPVKATVKGQHLGAAVTAWFTTSNGRFDVRWTTDANGTNRDGVVFAGYDYQRVQTGGVRAFPPLRAPGQYFDEETGLHENWNRYYDPAAGRYLSPEPLLHSPGYVRTMAARGMQVPTYAYAANNPLRYVDPDGLDIQPHIFDANMRRTIERYRSTQAGREKWDRMNARPEKILLVSEDAAYNIDEGTFTWGHTRKRKGTQVCYIDTRREWEGTDYDPAGVLGHELDHAETNLDAFETSRQASELKARIHQMFIELQLGL